MKGLIKIAIVLAFIYFAYKFYDENVSGTGKLKKQKEDQDNKAAISQLAKKLKTNFNEKAQATCNSRYVEGVYEWSDVEVCKSMKRAEMNGIDWEERARVELGL